MISAQTRLRLLEAALRLIAERGLEKLRMRDVALEAGCALGLAYRHFPGRAGFVLALYEELAAALEAAVPEIPAGTVAARFRFVAARKLALLAPQEALLRALLAAGLDARSRTGVLGAETARVRLRVQSVFAAAVAGAEDAPEERDQAGHVRLLYALHLGLVLAQVQVAGREDAQDIMADILDMATESVMSAGALRRVPAVEAWLGRADGLLGRMLGGAGAAERGGESGAVLRLLERRLRLRAGADRAAAAAGMRAVWGARLDRLMAGSAPIRLVLPGFPARPPNPSKVLGPLPDMAEWLALAGLRELCAQIAALHAPGVELVLCSDGHVFAEVVGITDGDCDRYRAALEEVVAEQERLTPRAGVRLRFFDLRDAFVDFIGQDDPGGRAGNADGARARLLLSCAEPEAAFAAELERSPELQATVDGVHRFLVEDACGADPGLSRSAARRRERAAAKEVVRRSRAWARLIQRAYPEAVRLSIHPQPVCSEKIGVYLLADGADHPGDPWLTPWHGCALLGEDRARLVHRRDAEAMGARLVEAGGRPSHFEIGAEIAGVTGGGAA